MIKIYQIIFENNKSYIGQTKNIKKRLKEHIWEAKNKNYNWKFHNALRHFNFKFKLNILQKCDNRDDANEREIYWINEYDTFKNGYNSDIGGKGHAGYIPTKERRKQLSLLLLNKKHPIHSEKSKKKAKESWTEERKEKQRITMRYNIKKFYKNLSQTDKKKLISRQQKTMRDKYYSNKDWVKKRVETLKKTLNTREQKERMRLSSLGNKNSNFKWRWTIEKNNIKYDTEGKITLKSFCEQHKHLKLNSDSIQTLINLKNCNEIKYKCWLITKIKYEK